MTAASDRGTEPDPERDAHLQVALRHAPDANAAPPAALSDAILRAAHGAVAPAGRAARAPTGWLHRLGAAWAWLGRPRLAGALAGLMVATLVGVLWWDQPLERSLGPAAQAPLRSNDSPAAPTAATAPAETVVTQPKFETPAQDLEARVPAVAKKARTQDAAIAATPSPPALATPALVTTARRADAPVRERAELAAASVAAPVQSHNQALSKSAAPSSVAALASLAEVRAAIAAQPDHWTWQLDAEPRPRAMTPELQLWLARLDAAAGAALGSSTLPAPSTAEDTGATLHLLRDAVPHSSVHWGTEAVRVVAARGTPTQRRPGPPPQTARELAAELAQIAAR